MQYHLVALRITELLVNREGNAPEKTDGQCDR